MASSEKRPRKGILKTSTSFDQVEHNAKGKEMKWDEMNILATHHPPDKDYGHMKIDEPPTPYNKYSEGEDEEEGETLERRGSFGHSSKSDVDPTTLTDRLEGLDHKRVRKVSTEEEESSEDDEDLTPEQLAHKKQFQQKRKMHYNEFQAVLLAKQLLDEEDDDDADDEANTNEANDEDLEENNGNATDSVQMVTEESGISLESNSGDQQSESPRRSQGAKRSNITTMDDTGHLETQIN